jgi:nucleoside-diphosphate-sugar epimerase
MPEKIVILGCGFVGVRAARLFAAAGWDAVGVTRSSESVLALAGEPYRILACDITDPRALASAGDLAGASAVISAVSSGRGGEETYRAVYLHGLENAISILKPARVLFTSSTSVYAQNDGAWVTEQSPAHPLSATSRILREAEEMALRHGGQVARLAGIYGPGRSVLLRKFIDGTAFIEGAGARHINQIQVDDAAHALFHLIATHQPPGIYNVSDDTPITQRACYEWLAAHLGRPLPHRGDIDPNRKRGVTDKRVSNAKLRASGWSPVYPSFQEAVIRDPALLAAARAGGTGDAPP